MYEIPNPLIKKFQKQKELLAELKKVIQEEDNPAYVLNSQFERLTQIFIGTIQIFLDSLESDDKIKWEINLAAQRQEEKQTEEARSANEISQSETK